MDIPIELFLGFIGTSIALAIFGFVRNPQIPATLVFGGLFILTVSISTTNIIMSYSSISATSEQISYSVFTNSGNVNIFSPTNTIRAENPANSASVILGDVIDCIDIFLVKTGSPLTSVLVEVGVFDNSGTTIKSFGTVNVTTITSTVRLYTFCLIEGDTYTIGSMSGTNENIGVKYMDGNSTNRIDTRVDNTDPFDSVNTVLSTFNSGTMTWTDSPTIDMTMELYLRGETNVTEENIYEFTELPKTLFGLIGVIFMLAGALMVARN